jgi:hypothetical protein
LLKVYTPILFLGRAKVRILLYKQHPAKFIFRQISEPINGWSETIRFFPSKMGKTRAMRGEMG